MNKLITKKKLTKKIKRKTKTRKYSKNIKNCKKSPKRGAYSLIKLKEIAVKNFKINVQGLSKDKICDLIEKKMNLYKKYSVKKSKIIDLQNSVKSRKKKLMDLNSGN